MNTLKNTLRITLGRRLLAASLAALALSFGSGCGPSFQAQTPDGFVELDNDWDDYDYRATTADGLVIAARAIEHDPEGSEAFWLKAIKNRMRESGGYALISENEVTSADGVRGTQLRFGHDDEGAPHLYYLAVFVTPETIFLVEAGGAKELMIAHEAQITAAVTGFRTN